MQFDVGRAGFRLLVLAIALLAALFAGCDSDAPEPGPAVELRKVQPMEADLLATSNEMAIDLARIVYEGDRKSNIFISSFNVSMAVGALLNGTSEERNNRVRQFLGMSQYNSTEINKAYSEIRSLFEVIDPGVTVRMVNGIWAPLDYPFDDAFTTKVMAYYDAEVRGLDFSRDLSVKMINRWAGLKSGGSIPDLVKDVRSTSGMVYTGGAVFQGAFTYSFDPDLTHKAAFNLGRRSVEVEMLQAVNMPVRYLLNKNMSFTEVDYGKGYYCLSILMPMGEAQLDDLLKDLREDVFTHMVENADSLYADITIPRFSIDYESDMNALFGGTGSRILREVLMSDRMFRDKVPESSSTAYFRALIQNEVNGSFSTGTGHHHQLNHTSANSILIDRPFLFFVRERHTNAILFFGILRNPNA